MSDIQVSGLSYYPIKSCGAVEAGEVTFSEFGIEHDREWMLVNARGNFKSQRNHPELSLVQTKIEGGSLLVIAPHMGELAISMEHDPDAEQVPVIVWKKPGTGRVADAETNDYFSEYLGRDARLLRVDQPREVKPECRVAGATARMGFADGFPLLLSSKDSLAELNEHLENPIPMNRFRPNIVVEGAPAYDEDYWREVRIGQLRAFVVRACDRCPVPNVPQDEGVLPKEKPVSEALKATRHGIDPVNGTQGDFFAQNLVHVYEPGTVVRVGDVVEVEERSKTRNFLLT